MAINRLSKQAEQRLTAALEKVASLVADGTHPDDAIVKIASEDGVPAGHVNLMVNAFNTGRTETQRKIGSDIFEKAAEFDIADAENILKRMFPSEVKTAAALARETVISEEYSLPPTWHRDIVKKATYNQTLPPLQTKAGHTVTEAPKLSTDPAFAMKKAYCQVQTLNKEVDNRRAEVANLQDVLISEITKLAEYFRKPGCEPYVGVKGNITRLFGKKAEALCSLLENRNKKLVKQASSGSEYFSLANFQIEPYSLIKGCLDTADKLVEKKAAFEKFEKEAAEKAEQTILPFSQTIDPLKGYSVLDEVEKRSFLSTKAIASSLGNAIGAANANIGKEIVDTEVFGKDKAYNKVLNSLQDPNHHARLRNMQTSSMLTDLMSNDEIISGYEPEEVLNHYNEISQIAPRASGHEGIMRAMLRKRLEGGKSAIDTYDLSELLKMENSLKDRDKNPYLSLRSLSTDPLSKTVI